MIRLQAALLLGFCAATGGPASPGRQPPPALDTHGVIQEFVRIPAGSFVMGSDARPEEGPPRAVAVESFDLATTEVTVRQFRAFVQATGYVTDAERAGHSFLCCWRPKLGVNWHHPGFAQSDEDPVLAVSWNDAREFCTWLSRETGRCYRLPTEAEWEYAARRDQDGQALESSAWYERNAGGRSHPVRTRTVGRLGLYDLLGNAWEWVEDRYHGSYAGAPVTARAWSEDESHAQEDGGKAGDGRILRGGSWGACDCRHPAAYEVTVTSRPTFGAAQSCNNSGFRLARAIEPAPERASRAAGPAAPHRATPAIEWIDLPAGAFEFGDPHDATGQKRIVFAGGLRMMRNEVTVAQFRTFVEASGYVTDAERKGWAWDSDFRSRHAIERKVGASWSSPGFEQSPSDPVTMVSWNDAQAFCRWLSAETGLSYRLPAEAEWEYAATSGGSDPERPALKEVAWYFDNSGLRTHPVGTRGANAWGFHDMLGNAAEWVLDAWSPNLGTRPTDGTALLGLLTSARVLRGGSYEREANEFGLRARDWQDRAEAVAGIGFRVVTTTR